MEVSHDAGSLVDGSGSGRKAPVVSHAVDPGAQDGLGYLMGPSEPVYIGVSSAQAARLPGSKDVERVAEVYAQACQKMDLVLADVWLGQPLDGCAVSRVVKELLACLLESPSVMTLLVHAKGDPERIDPAVSHALHVTILTLLVGHRMGLVFDQLYCHGLGALLHDVGELVGPRPRMFERSRTVEERRVQERHPLLGVRLVQTHVGIPEESMRIILEHHERWDGEGYPYQRQGSEIDEGSQLVGALDYYDHLVSGRLDGQAIPPADALRGIVGMAQRGAWNGRVVDRICATLGSFPIGSLVGLNTGHTGVVVMSNPDGLRPIVRLLADEAGHPLHRVAFVDLQAKPEWWIDRVIPRDTNVYVARPKARASARSTNLGRVEDSRVCPGDQASDLEVGQVG